MKRILQAAALAAVLVAPAFTTAASATSTYVGPYGGTSTFDRDCYAGSNARFCHNVRTYTGPNGKTFEQGRGFYSGPNSFGRTGHTVAPNGHATGFYRAHGYGGGRATFRGWR
jgi:hypothetical protein